MAKCLQPPPSGECNLRRSSYTTTASVSVLYKYCVTVCYQHLSLAMFADLIVIVASLVILVVGSEGQVFATSAIRSVFTIAFPHTQLHANLWGFFHIYLHRNCLVC